MSPSLSIISTNGTSTTNGFSSVNKPEIPRSVAVYCGANLGTEPAFHHAAICLVYRSLFLFFAARHCSTPPVITLSDP